MATELQKIAIKKVIEKKEKGKNISIKRIMIESGYSPKTAINPSKLTRSIAWREFKDTIKDIDYAKHLQQLDALADTSMNKDKDNALRSKKMLFDLGDKFPKKESKIFDLFKDF